MLNARKQWAVGAAGLAACAALFGSLFLTWYHVVSATETSGASGFLAVFGSGTSDAWDAVADTSLVIAGCSLVIGALLVFRLIRGSRRAVVAAAAVALICAGVIGYRMISGPDIPRGIQASYFDRANMLPGPANGSISGVTPTSSASGGAVLAVCAALVAAGAGCALAISKRTDA